MRLLAKLELFEWVGILASLVAAWIFFRYGTSLDDVMGKPGYHWHMLTVIIGIYGRFIPYAIGFGAVVFGLVWWTTRMRQVGLWIRFGFGLRLFLAYCVLLIVFRVVNFYVPVLHPGIRDAAIQQIDMRLLGGKLISDWLEPIVRAWLTAILTGAYVAWFWLLFATLLLLVNRDERRASEYVFASLMAFYIGYIGYVLVPVIGPGYTVHYAVHVGDIAPQFTTHRLHIARDCFPSLHTALSVLMTIYVWRYRPIFGWIYTLFTALIILATLYLRWHYFLDDVAGASLAVTVSYTATIFASMWERVRGQESEQERLSPVVSVE